MIARNSWYPFSYQHFKIQNVIIQLIYFRLNTRFFPLESSAFYALEYKRSGHLETLWQDFLSIQQVLEMTRSSKYRYTAGTS